TGWQLVSSTKAVVRGILKEGGIGDRIEGNGVGLEQTDRCQQQKEPFHREAKGIRRQLLVYLNFSHGGKWPTRTLVKGRCQLADTGRRTGGKRVAAEVTRLTSLEPKASGMEKE